MRWFVRFLRDQKGAIAVEYCVMLLLVLMVVIVAVGSLGSNTGGLWGGINTKLNNAKFGQ